MNGQERKIDYMRISITDRCNLRCKYCMPYDIESIPMQEILTYEELEEIVQAAASCGISHLRITGGEPLVRKGCAECIRKLKKVPGIETVTLTTNGVLLESVLPDLLEAGIDGINISLDTLDRKNYKAITGTDAFDSVWKAIHASIRNGVTTKINVAAAEEINGEEILEFVKLTKELPADIRFIEMMPIGYGKNFHSLNNELLRKQIRKEYPDLYTAEKRKHTDFGPAVYYQIPNFKGRIGLISALHGKFCRSCNRLRLTSTGQLKYCLCYDKTDDLRKIVRTSGRREERQKQLQTLFREAGRKKPEGHCFEKPDEISERKKMNQIGG